MDVITKRVLYDICVNHGDVMVVDTLNYLHRYLWVHRDLSARYKDNIVMTGHIYGFTNLILSLKKRFNKCAIILALDGIDKTRKQLNPNYKSHRSHSGQYQPDEQLMEIIDICSLIEGVYVCYNPDYEADDAIGVVANTVRRICVRNNISKNIFILSNDKDMYQLVNEDDNAPIRIIKGFQGDKKVFNGAEVIGVSDVCKRFNGVSPKDLVKYRAIVGDPSDNLKGYYRFIKSKAALIAKRYDYDEDKKELKLKDGLYEEPTLQKYVDKVFEDLDVFRNNYDIMKLKHFDLKLDPINSVERIKDIGYIVGLAKAFGLKRYLDQVCMYSPYASEILKCL